MQTSDNVELRLLEWYAAMGVDEAIADAPCDWFNLTPPPAQAQLPAATPRMTPASQGSQRFAALSPSRTPASPPLAPRPQGGGPARVPPIAAAASAATPDLAVMAAREEARKAATLQEVEAALARFDGCPLKKTAKTMCFARGNPEARLMIIGEAPGRDEDVAGKPFVGRAGKLLDKMLAAIGLQENDVYITNVVYWRPPGNRTPTPQEIQTCQPFLERQIELVAPQILVFAGGSAAKQFLGATEGILKMRGKWRSYASSGKQIRCMATLHPAYLLRSPASKRLAWRDLLAIRMALDENRPPA
jgi:uracil-DNA glycosylase